MAYGPLIKEVIRRLERDNRGFGNRHLSFYAQDPIAFSRYVENLAVVKHLFSGATEGKLDKDLTDSEQQKMKEIIDRVDRYGRQVRGLSSGWKKEVECKADLAKRLQFWVRRNVPASLWTHPFDLQKIVADLMQTLQDNVTAYTFEDDLLVWALPHLTRQFCISLMGNIRRTRPDLDFLNIEKKITPRAESLLEMIEESFGIHSIRAYDVVQRALFLLIAADDDEYYEWRRRGPGWDMKWAMDKLKDQIKLQILFHCEPDFRLRWDYHSSAAERQKRQRLLEIFSRIVQPVESEVLQCRP